LREQGDKTEEVTREGRGRFTICTPHQTLRITVFKSREKRNALVGEKRNMYRIFDAVLM
jgi:hypothetical protein